ncbi:MAG: type II toxin-antitoxin system VapC family toxin [Gemmatimonadetes bacterium]|nr:type II toxin-antitoxin system VapC family toxin [Gemmatimonadota bacterium]
MILADTSVWIEHLRRGNATLRTLLEAGESATHPFVIGELACGALGNRAEVLGLLERLPMLPVAEHHEVLAFVEAHRLMRRGLGWIDVHLLASAVLGGARILTLDRRLAAAAADIGVA